ncbi:MAG: glycosyltransferase [Actinomycetota bacterium]|nr:glycosyltransferase [Actinomycetota bacterium]
MEVLPFGYDERWFPLTLPTGPKRQGVAFLGTWSPRRERYLSALQGLPLIVRGTGWERSKMTSGPPLTEGDAGAILRRSCIGVNLLHPQNVGSHNMRTREIAASGALELTDPGTDGTQLRPGESCVWFKTPEELRDRAIWFLDRPADAQRIAARAQDLIAPDTYVHRGEAIGRLIAEVVDEARKSELARKTRFQ